MHTAIHTAAGREIHRSINPALAAFDRALCRVRRQASQKPAGTDDRTVSLARAQAVVARTRLLWN